MSSQKRSSTSKVSASKRFHIDKNSEAAALLDRACARSPPRPLATSPPPHAAPAASSSLSSSSSSLDIGVAIPAANKYTAAVHECAQAERKRVRRHDKLLLLLHVQEPDLVLTETALARVTQVAEMSRSDFAFAATTGSGHHWKFCPCAADVLPACDAIDCPWGKQEEGNGYYHHVFSGDNLCARCYPTKRAQFEEALRTPDLPALFKEMLDAEVASAKGAVINYDTHGYKYEWRHRLGPACPELCLQSGCGARATEQRRGTRKFMCERHWHEAMGDRCSASPKKSDG